VPPARRCGLGIGAEAAVLNATDTDTIANNAVLGLSRNGDGSLNVLAVLSPAGTVHFLIDVNGYFQ